MEILNSMKILSLYDGISCGQLALQRVKIPYTHYYSSEVDKNCIELTKKKFPKTIFIGDITKVDFNKYKEIDLIIGGSPCQGFSIAGKQHKFDDERSNLILYFFEAIKICKPKYFLLENVIMKKESSNIVSRYLNIPFVNINSSLVSAQNRDRLYWTNIPFIGLPKDKNLYLKDIICYTEENKLLYNSFIKIINEKKLEIKIKSLNTKSKCITTTVHQPFGATVIYDKVIDKLRNLNCIELERLQTLPENYTKGYSDALRKKMIGNCWTVDIISWFFSFLKEYKI
jgi:DNA-cytosine methyltransferase